MIAVVYWFVSYEDAGTTMLVAAAGFSLFTGGWLWLRERRPPAADDEPAEEYFPHTSIWPFGIGVAGVLPRQRLDPRQLVPRARR